MNLFFFIFEETMAISQFVFSSVLVYSHTLYVISRSPSTVPIPSTHKPSTDFKPGSILDVFLKLAVQPSDQTSPPDQYQD